jgi:hypothetical protein
VKPPGRRLMTGRAADLSAALPPARPSYNAEVEAERYGRFVGYAQEEPSRPGPLITAAGERVIEAWWRGYEQGAAKRLAESDKADREALRRQRLSEAAKRRGTKPGEPR